MVWGERQVSAAREAAVNTGWKETLCDSRHHRDGVFRRGNRTGTYTRSTRQCITCNTRHDRAGPYFYRERSSHNVTAQQWYSSPWRWEPHLDAISLVPHRRTEREYEKAGALAHGLRLFDRLRLVGSTIHCLASPALPSTAS